MKTATYEFVLLLIFVAAVFEGAASWAIKTAYLHQNHTYLGLAAVLYIVMIFLFYVVYHYEGISITNAYYNAFSFVIITLVGTLGFQEKLTLLEKFGLGLIFGGILLISSESLTKQP
jgi:multidrug transporter EmrE-like cation transporter